MPSFKKDPAVAALKSLIHEKHLHTQQELCQTMQELGFNINQSKVSRLLRRMNVVKCKDEDGHITYRLPQEPAPPEAQASVSDLVIMIDANAHMVVVRTTPGAAPVIARVLDYHKDQIGMLGCVAGDDTILVTPKTDHNTQDCLHSIEKLLF